MFAFWRNVHAQDGIGEESMPLKLQEGSDHLAAVVDASRLRRDGAREIKESEAAAIVYEATQAPTTTRVGKRVVDVSESAGDLAPVVHAYGKRMPGARDIDPSDVPIAIREPMAPRGVSIVADHMACVVDALRRGLECAGNIEEGEGSVVVYEPPRTIGSRHQPGIADSPSLGEEAARAVDRSVCPLAQEKRVRKDSSKPIVAHHLAAVVDAMRLGASREFGHGNRHKGAIVVEKTVGTRGVGLRIAHHQMGVADTLDKCEFAALAGTGAVDGREGVNSSRFTYLAHGK